MPDHTLILARHGQTDWNLERRMQGRTDTVLNATGRRQARELATQLAEEAVGRALVSPLRRARETAAVVAGALPGLRFEVEPRLTEVDLGAWEGGLEAELLKRADFQAWRADPVAHHAPGGEGALEVARRVAPLLDTLAESPAGGRILLLGHQFTNGVIYCLVTGIPLTQVRSWFTPPGRLLRAALPARNRHIPP